MYLANYKAAAMPLAWAAAHPAGSADGGRPAGRAVGPPRRPVAMSPPLESAEGPRPRAEGGGMGLDAPWGGGRQRCGTWGEFYAGARNR